MSRKRKIKRRVRKDKSELPVNVDLVDLNNLFVKFCAKILKGGDIDKVARIISFMKELSQGEMVYEKDFALRHLKRHGLE